MSKRGRSNSGKRVHRGPARPIDKELKVINKVAGVAVVSTQLKGVTFPGTVVGIRWEIGASSLIAANSVVQWAIVVLQDGESANEPNTGDGSDFYKPEQNVLAFGMAKLMGTTNNGAAAHWIGSTKTMRKLKQGDVLACLVHSDTDASADVDGIIQFFFKT